MFHRSLDLEWRMIEQSISQNTERSVQRIEQKTKEKGIITLANHRGEVIKIYYLEVF
jgi:hypothetical protein